MKSIFEYFSDALKSLSIGLILFGIVGYFIEEKTNITTKEAFYVIYSGIWILILGSILKYLSQRS